MNPGLVEAMGSGALIAAFGTNFNRDTVADTGVFFEDPDHAAQEVFSQLADMDHDALRASARLRATDTFSLKRVADLYEETLLAAAKR